jgi:hypothetical protein
LKKKNLKKTGKYGIATGQTAEASRARPADKVIF